MRVVAIISTLATVLALGGCDRGSETPQQIEGNSGTAGHAATQPSQTNAAQGAPSGQSVTQGEPTSVHSVVIGTDGKEKGTVAIEPIEHGVRISLHVEDLQPGSHAVHFHEHGKCEPPDFQSAGGHYNPAGAKHGMTDMDENFSDQDHHAGDMLNQKADDKGVMDALIVNDSVTLNGTNALLDQDGSALIIHAGPDDYQSQPAGDAGPRVACAVIGAEQTAGSTQ